MKTHQNNHGSISPEAILKLKAMIRRLQHQCDPAYASARPWDWQVCKQCGQLVPREENRCPACGSRRFDVNPLGVFRRGFHLYGAPPSLFE